MVQKNSIRNPDYTEEAAFNYTLKWLNSPHSPTSKSEMERIKKLGGRIVKQSDVKNDKEGFYRLEVKGDRDISYLSTTRAIGCFCALRCGLLPVPETKVFTLDDNIDLGVLLVTNEVMENLNKKRVE